MPLGGRAPVRATLLPMWKLIAYLPLLKKAYNAYKQRKGQQPRR
ncbi:hypothetical protein RHODO2019_10365 [Rhodococcus antarcticus]|uniref:Uncharacterized protein n=1 Tax=Rhodococcus antarcticus TaxID=2987751 RepID=A0ABY6NW55_9NOCA|nr:hypothetical protein [Rhodococcus antarcticus]UZJ23619.1 hypothetical protein RHODO2019_10365 [Rhodococcus antarcticus]